MFHCHRQRAPELIDRIEFQDVICPRLQDILGMQVAEINSKGARSRVHVSAREMRLLWIGQRGEACSRGWRLEKTL